MTAAAGGTPMQRDRATTIFEKSHEGRRAFVPPALDVPEDPDALPERFRRREPPRLPEIAEPEINRHFNRISKRNFDLDTGFYPLGSCTMKHNPKLHERVAALPGNARLHPAQAPARAQGALQLMYELQGALGEIAGLPHVSLQPSAGSHGELAGVLLTRAFHEANGDQRHKVLTPDTAHGTNPATVTMAGYEVVKIGTDDQGGVDMDDLKANLDEDVACLMLTNPNTLGVFDTNIEEIAQLVHGVGATLYYDGANLNAVMGRDAAGRHGLRHRPLQPPQDLHAAARRRRPGRGADRGLGPDRAVPAAAPGGQDAATPTTSTSTGRSRSGACAGSRATTASSCAPTPTSCRSAATACRRRRRPRCSTRTTCWRGSRRTAIGEHLPVAFDRLCMHEFVLSGAPMKKNLGLRTTDLAKRLLDHGYHPPTVYFPLLVDEALLIEPTETETRETLDGFADAIAEILREGAEDPEIARNAPYSTPVRRLDEAARRQAPGHPAADLD